MIYSANLYTGLLTPVNTLLFTVPSGNVCVVRDVESVATVGPANNVALQAEVAGTTATFFLSSPQNAYEWVQWEGRVVIPAGGSIHGSSQFAGTQIIISGYLLT